MKYFIICIMAISCHNTFSQYRGINWALGDSLGINFNETIPSIFETGIFTFEPCATISNEKGELEIYTNGAIVWNKNHEIMNLGNHLDITSVTYPLSSTTQLTIILPDPGNINKYYIFHKDGIILKYSIVDINEDSGLGSVFSRNNIAGSIPGMTEKMIAVKHGNGRDWWILIHAYPEGGSDDYGNNFRFHSFLLTPDGINESEIQEGFVYNNQNTSVSIGQMKSNKTSDKLAITNGKSILIYNFDRCSGLVSENYAIDSVFIGNSGDYLYGIEFSESGQNIYVTKVGASSKQSILYQFSLYDTTYTSYTKTILVEDPNIDLHYFSQLQIGPNNRIYLSIPIKLNALGLKIQYLGEIKFPNNVGSDCLFDTLYIDSNGNKITHALPNMPNYNLGVLPKSACDTLSTAITEIKTNTDFQLFPNPVSSAFYITSKNETGKSFQLRIADAVNKEVFVMQNYFPGNAVLIDKLPQGIYVVTLLAEDKVVFSEKMLIVK